MFFGKSRESKAEKSYVLRVVSDLIYWFFPLILLLIGFLMSKKMVPAFGLSILKLPIDNAVWLPLLIMLIAAVAWLLLDLFWVFNRETPSKTLQANIAISNFQGMIFCGMFGYLLNSAYGIPWWFVVPFFSSTLDSFTTGWAAINNATQKPFLTQQGSR